MKRRGTTALPVLFLTAVVAAGCAGAPRWVPGSSAGTASEIAELQRRVLELQRRAAVADVEIQRLRQGLAQLEAQARVQPRASSAAGQTTSAPSTVASSPVTRSPVEPIIENDLPEEAAVAPPALATQRYESSVPSGAATTGASLPPSLAAQAAYDAAYTAYHQGRYVDAETGFRRFLLDHGSTDLADNAAYWIGESRYARRDVQGALLAFQEAVETYPDGNKTPDALFKVGQSLESLGDLEGARAAFEEVLRRYPGEPAADLARQRLAALR